MRILLTGALGFIGKNFLLHRPKDWQVFALVHLVEDQRFQKLTQNSQFFTIDLTNDIMVKKLAKKMPDFDVCLHLAANGDPALSVLDPGWDLKATTMTLINVCQYFSIKKFIYLSSGAVYDGNFGQVGPKIPVDPTLPYAISHLTAERYTRFFNKDGEYVVIRFFGAYGPFEPPRKIYTKLIKDIVIEKKKEFTIRGDGLNLIDAMYIEDAIRGFQAVIMSPKANLTVDFCKGDHPTINSLVKETAQIFGRDVAIKHEGIVPEYNRFYASPKKFKEVFNFSPKIQLDEGLKKLYQFYVK